MPLPLPSRPMLAIAMFAMFAVFAPLVALASPAEGQYLRPAGRFDDRVQTRIGGTIGVDAKAIGSLAPADPLRTGWEEFARRNGDVWEIHIDERTGMPTLVAGRGIAWLADEALARTGVEPLEALVRRFMTEHRALLGDWGTTLELDRGISRELQPGHWQIAFRQVVDGVPVENARLQFHIKQGRLVMFGASAWGTPRIDGVPSIDAADARRLLEAYLGTPLAGLIEAREPELVILAVDPDPSSDGSEPWNGPRGEGLGHALVWRLRYREPDRPALWVAEIDAHDGTVRAFFDGAHYAAIRGGVFPISNDGQCEDQGCEIAGYPMPYADFAESGQTQAFADSYGAMTCADPGAIFATSLDGTYIRVADACGPISITGSCETGADLGLKQAGENCASAAPDGTTAAARSSYYHLNRIAEAARFYDPANAWLQSQVTVNVNAASNCNAFWNGDINMFGAGSGCRNTGEGHGVLVHEWGHGYDENDGGGFDITSEAYADVVTIFAERASCISRGWYYDGRTCSGYGDTCLTCTGIRDHDWAARANNTPATPEGFLLPYCPSGGGGPCNREAHCESYVISEAIFDLATRDLPASGIDPETSWQLAERLWYVTRPGSGGNIYNCFRINLTHSCDATSWLQRMRVADDDDGNLANGTPHAAALQAAFARHDIGCGSAGDAKNQSTSSCPTLAAPALSVARTPTSIDLEWTPVAGAAAYRVYRGDLGCDRQQAGIADVPSTQTSYSDTVVDRELAASYRVEAFTSNPACHSPVSNCELSPIGARLQKNGQRFEEDPALSNGDGDVDPGETIRIPVTLLNTGAEIASGITGRVRVAEGALARIVAAGATWPDLAPSGASDSDAPHFGLTVFEGVPCGETLHFELDSRAVNDVVRTSTFDLRLGEQTRDVLNDQIVMIPPETVEPLTSTLVLDQDLTITDLDVTVTITHQHHDELVVELTSPEGTTVRLQDHASLPSGTQSRRYDLERQPDGPGTMADFVGETTLGTWTLSITDDGPLSSGTLQNWTLHAAVAEGWDCAAWSCGEAIPSEAVAGLTVDKAANGANLDLVLAWSPVAGVAGYHVLQSPGAAFDGAVELADKTAGATTSTLADGVHTTPDLTYFQIRAANGCNQEGP